MRTRLVWLAYATGAAAAPSLAGAQAVGSGPTIVIEPVLDRDDVAGARIEPAYQPQPIRFGPTLVRPSISIVGEYFTNVFNRPQASAAAAVTVMPSLSLRTDFPRHELGLSASGTLRRFARQRTENSEEFAVGADTRIDLGARHRVRARAGLERLIEPRSTAGSIADAAEPVSYGRLSGDLGATLEFGRLRASPTLRYERLDYSDVRLTGGGKADQAFRDTRSLRGEIRIDYEFSGLVSAFAAASREDIDSTAAPAPLRRDAHDASLVAGLRGALTPVVSGELGLGYRRRDQARADLRDFRGLTFRADLQWYITPLLTLRAQADRGFRNSGNPAVGAIRADRFILTAYYDPLRNLRLSASAEVEHGDFREIDARTWRKALRLRAQYRISRRLSIGGYMGVLRQDVSGPQVVVPFTAFSAGIGMTVTP